MKTIKNFRAKITVETVEQGSYGFKTSSWRKSQSTEDGHQCFMHALQQMALIAEVCGIAGQAKDSFVQEIDSVHRRLEGLAPPLNAVVNKQ